MLTRAIEGLKVDNWDLNFASFALFKLRAFHWIIEGLLPILFLRRDVSAGIWIRSWGCSRRISICGVHKSARVSGRKLIQRTMRRSRESITVGQNLT